MHSQRVSGPLQGGESLLRTGSVVHGGRSNRDRSVSGLSSLMKGCPTMGRVLARR